MGCIKKKKNPIKKKSTCQILAFTKTKKTTIAIGVKPIKNLTTEIDTQKKKSVIKKNHTNKYQVNISTDVYLHTISENDSQNMYNKATKKTNKNSDYY